MHHTCVYTFLVLSLIICGTTRILADASTDSLLIRQTSKGRVRGARQASITGQEVDSFLGIPFAKPPVGDLRFRRPEPVASWSGTFNATKLPNSCPQEVDTAFGKFRGVDMWNPNTPISEDCLYLNVWQPVGGGKTPKAVMVWIYGGGFYSGTSTLDLYDGRVIASTGDVIVVSMQYRVGPFGFLFFNSTDAPGNMGLLDQMLALKWIQENIAHFGGDARRVTVFGESAGAASASYQILSPLTKDLVNSIIMESASANGEWAFDEPALAVSRGLALAERVGCSDTGVQNNSTSDSYSGVINCLRKISAARLSSEQWELHDSESEIQTPFVPTLDGYFLTKSPLELLRDNFIQQKAGNILLGTNKAEGMYFLVYQQKTLFPVNGTTKPLTEAEYRVIVKSLLKDDAPLVVDNVAFEYGTPHKYTKTPPFRDSLENVLGDLAFKCPIVEFAQAYLRAGKTAYLYSFNHQTSGNPWPQWLGVLHGYEIDHVFGQPLFPAYSQTYREEERALSANMITYWTNFAKTGDPNVAEAGSKKVNYTWPKYTLDDRQVLVLDTPSLATETGMRDRQCEYWRTIVPQLRRAARGKFDAATCGGSVGRSNLISKIAATYATAVVILIYKHLSLTNFAVLS